MLKERETMKSKVIVGTALTLLLIGMFSMAFDIQPVKASSPSPDINRDGIVDIFDVVTAASAFGSYPGHPRWNPIADIKQDGIIDIFDLVIIGINFGMHTFFDVVGTSTTSTAIMDSFQRKTFFACNRFWVFYADGTNIVYKTSTDGAEWGDSVVVRACTTGYHFSLWFDETYVHYAYGPQSPNTPIYYCRGTPFSNGSITWSAEQTAVEAQENCGYYTPYVCVDSEGCPWIAYRLLHSPHSYAYVTKSSANDSTWTTASGFPHQVSTTDYSIASVTPLTSHKIIAVYSTSGSPIKARLWNGSSWGEEENCTTSNCYQHIGQSVVNEGDDVHLVFHTTTPYAGQYAIKYVKRTYGVGWGTEVTVQTNVTQTSCPVLSTSGMTIYCFWVGSPTVNHVYYKKCVAGVWDSNPTDWMTRTYYAPNYDITCYYKSYGNHIGLVYLMRDTSPYLVDHNYLNITNE